MEELVASTMAVQLPCSHVFHSECLRVWLSKQHTCPTCRAKLPTRADREAKDVPLSWANYPLPTTGMPPVSAMYT
jgi:E3 ubiquitin-protein ligase synoviolin